MKKFKLPLLITVIVGLNALIYFRAAATIEPSELIFAECARNSGRTAAALNLVILLLIGYFGLKAIYKKERTKSTFQTFMILFAINHLIHFFFVYQNFKSQFVELDISHNLHGFITFILILVFPIILMISKNLNKFLYAFILLHLFNVTYFISISFYSRVKPVDPAYLHQIGILIMMLAVLYVLYRVFLERSVNFISDNER